MKNVLIPNSVMSIGQGAFKDCAALESIFLPDSVITIGENAFYGCQNLTIFCESSCKLEGWEKGWNSLENSECPVEFNSFNGEYGSVNGINYIVYKNSDGSPYVSIVGYTLPLCGQLIVPSKIHLDSMDAIVTEIRDYAFQSCQDIESIRIPATVTKLGDYAFSNCASLTQVTFEANSQLNSIGISAFSGCSHLANINLEKADHLDVINDSAFSSCQSLTSICLPENLTSLGEEAFFSCSSLESLYIPESVSNICENTFYGCSELTIYCECSVNASLKWDYRWNAFGMSIADSSEKLCPVIYNSYKGIHGNDNGLLFVALVDKNNKPYISIIGYVGNEIDLVLPSMMEADGVSIPVTSIEDEAFSESFLRSIYIRKSISFMGRGVFNVLNSSRIRIYCEVDEVQPDWWWNPVGYRVFWNCAFPSQIDEDFLYVVCRDEEERKFAIILDYLGADKNVVVPSFFNIGGENILVKELDGGAFSDCVSIETIQLPPSVEKIGEEAFKHCINLTSINIPAQVSEIGNSAFEGCENLSEVLFESGSQLKNIGNSAFDGCV